MCAYIDDVVITYLHEVATSVSKGEAALSIVFGRKCTFIYHTNIIIERKFSLYFLNLFICQTRFDYILQLHFSITGVSCQEPALSLHTRSSVCPNDTISLTCIANGTLLWRLNGQTIFSFGDLNPAVQSDSNSYSVLLSNNNNVLESAYTIHTLPADMTEAVIECGDGNSATSTRIDILGMYVTCGW